MDDPLWTAVDDHLTRVLVGPDPALDAALGGYSTIWPARALAPRSRVRRLRARRGRAVTRTATMRL